MTEYSDADTCELDAPQVEPSSATDLRAAALSPGIERDELFKTHPLTRRPVEIRTLAIESAYLDVCEAVTYRQLGLCFCAPFRLGKSTAALLVAANIKATVPRLAVHLTVAKAHDRVTERVFYGDLCDSMMLQSGGTAEARAYRVRKAIQAACHMARSDQLLLIIDEGQNWGVREWEWLRDTSNDLLNKHKITITTATFADPRIVDVRSNLRRGRQDLWGRFMMKLKSFSGIKSAGDLAYFLSMLDQADQYEYPVGSGISYTEFYLPKAFSAGWRVESQAEAIWQAFQRAASSTNCRADEIGMQWIGDTMSDFFTNQSAADHKGFTPTNEMWDDSVAAANFIESLI